MLKKATRARGQRSPRGTRRLWPLARTRARSPPPPTRRQTVRNVHGSISRSASFIAGQLLPQRTVSAPGGGAARRAAKRAHRGRARRWPARDAARGPGAGRARPCVSAPRARAPRRSRRRRRRSRPRCRRRRPGAPPTAGCPAGDRDRARGRARGAPAGEDPRALLGGSELAVAVADQVDRALEPVAVDHDPDPVALAELADRARRPAPPGRRGRCTRRWRRRRSGRR